eukprot:TRINITY_DN2025_c0_g3_i1.p1 TRINITY_DN2025_c0_g3~~TRINITY_DN2025_c0_g3_i1.p1  ORF type:complete len:484 (-),score=103.71 TRINITY_DN2025_c0_g3_i1:399-1850(-)
MKELDKKEAPLLTRPVVTRKVRIAYAFGGFGIFLYATIKGIFFLIFLADVAKVDPVASGFILLFGKCIDALTDPFVGQLSDRTQSRWGRRRPWLIFGAIPFGVSYFLLWIVPSDDPTTNIAYYFVMSVILDALGTVVYVPYSSLLTDLADSYDERTRLTSLRQVFGLLGTIVGTIGHGAILFATSDGDTLEHTEKGYLISGVVFGILIAVPLLVVGFFVEERPSDQNSDVQVRESLTEFANRFIAECKYLLRNRSYVILVGIYLFSFMVNQFFQGSFLLWIENVLKENKGALVLLIIATLCSVVIIITAARVSQRLGKKTTYVIFSGVALPFMLSTLFIKEGQLGVVLFMIPFITFNSATSLLLPLAMLPDIIDKDELDSSVRREGSFFSFFLMAQKVAQALALAIINFSIGLAGYKAPDDDEDAEDVEQPDSVIVVLRLLVGPVPFCCGLAALSLLRIYPMTKQVAEDVKRQLALRQDTNDI